MNKAKPFVVREEKLGESAQPSAEDKTEAEKEVKTATEKNEKESVNE
jgi:hypothetical protein